MEEIRGCWRGAGFIFGACSVIYQKVLCGSLWAFWSIACETDVPVKICFDMDPTVLTDNAS